MNHLRQIMLVPLILSAPIWLSASAAVYTQGHETQDGFKHTSQPFKQTQVFKPTEEQAKNIKFDYGWSPEARRLNRHERLAFKLSALINSL